MAARLDEQLELIFTLRRVDAKDLVTQAGAGLPARAPALPLVPDALLLPQLPAEARAAVRRMGRAERARAGGAPAVRVHAAQAAAPDLQPAPGALSDAVRFFHMDALSSAVGLKVDFDMALLVIASDLYRLLARRMRGYAEAQARHIFRDLIDTPADVSVSKREVHVHFHRRAHLPIIVASGMGAIQTDVVGDQAASLTSWVQY